MHEKHKANQNLQRKERNKEEKKTKNLLITKEERTKEQKERITRYEFPSPRPVE